MDKFYTKPEIVEKCVPYFSPYVVGEKVVEPSAGNGAFAKYVDLMLDIKPEGPNILQQDFFQFDSSAYKNYLGNPPFGTNSQLAKNFINHAAKGKGVIGFILPITFRKVSLQNLIDLNFHLLEDIRLPVNAFVAKREGEWVDYPVPCVFQVWGYHEECREKITLPLSHPDFDFVEEKDDWSFSIRRVGQAAGKVLDPEKTGKAPSHYFIRASAEVRERLEYLYEDFNEQACLSVYPSLGKGELVKIYSDFASQ